MIKFLKNITKSRISWFFIVLIFTFSKVSAQYILSEKSEIAVVTIGPYQGEVWSAFGHSGIRVYDPQIGINWFYNYGLYDFKQENFILNFAKGLLKYRVGASYYDRVLAHHKEENRWVKEQVLNLNREQRQQFFDFLQNNIQPENAEYLYHYVYDNCATKLIEIPQELFGEKVAFDFSNTTKNKTIRDLMYDYLDLQPWGKFGIDLGLGMQVDKEATTMEYMFLPEKVSAAFAGGKISTDSTSLPLVKEERLVVEVDETKDKFKVPFLTPLKFFVLLFFVVGFITNRDLKQRKRTKWIDAFLFSLAGFVSLWVIFLWFGTEHMSKWNLNILWALPSHLVMVFLLRKKSLWKINQRYFKVVGFWYIILLLIWGILPQPLSMALIPLVLAMVLRSFFIAWELGIRNK